MAKDQKHLAIRTIQCIVTFLDDSEAEFEIEKREKAQVLLNKVFDHLDISERKYFGLQFVDSVSPEDNVAGCSDMELMRWVDPAKSLKKQIKAFPPYFFFFRVKFYVPNPDCLVEEYTRYYFFLQLNKDLSNGRLHAPVQEVVNLTGLAVQSELGDYNPDEQSVDYLYGASFLPDHSEEFLKKVATAHRKLKGLRPAVCERSYLAIVKNFDGYGVNLYKAALEQTNEEIQLGVTSQGLVMFKNNIKLQTFIWAKIVKLSFKRKFFYIHLHKESPTEDTVENVYGFHMACYRTCKNLWKSCVEYHTFFCLHAQSSLNEQTTDAMSAKETNDLSQPSSKDQTKMSSTVSLHRDALKFDPAPSLSTQSLTSTLAFQSSLNFKQSPLLSSATHLQQQLAALSPLKSSNQQQQQQLQQQSSSDLKKTLVRSEAFRSSPVNVHPELQLVNPYKSPYHAPSEGLVGNNNINVVNNNKNKVVDSASMLYSSSSSPPITSSTLHNGSTRDANQSSSSSSSSHFSNQLVNNNSNTNIPVVGTAAVADYRFVDATSNSNTSNKTSISKDYRFTGVQLRDDRQQAGRDSRLATTSTTTTTTNSRHFPSSERRRTFEARPASHKPDDEFSEEEDGEIVEKTTTNVITTLSPVVLVTNSGNNKFSDDKSNRDGQKMSRNNSSNCLDGLKTVRMQPDEQGRFGFNVKGGADQMQPIIVSRVAPDSPAGQSVPRLCEGDHVLFINGRDVSQHTHTQVVQFIKASREIHSGELVLVVRPMVYSNDLSPGEPDFQYIPDTHHIVALLNPGEDKLAASITQLKESIESKAGILQFEQLYRKKAGMSMNISQLPENVPRNRYRDISPYDLTRVKLLSTPQDYINATFVNMQIPGSGLTNTYIATQGPLPDTTSDFWSMVYEQSCPLVVMLTVTEERGHVKCHKYWPDLGTTMTFKGLDFSVTCLSESSPLSSFICRYLVLHVGPEMQEHHVHQMQYVAWPDHGVPDDCTDFLEFINLVRQTKKGISEPTVVHCSAGIGRTGVLIAMETAMCMIEADQSVHMLEIVRQMRDQRAMLIQTSSQYKFVCEAVIKVYDDKIVFPLKEYSC